MRIPFLAGALDRARNRTRFLMAEGETPTPIKGPWTLRAVVKGDPDYVPSFAADTAEAEARSRSSTARAAPESSTSSARETPSA